jgi:hypothetical protein
MDPCPFKPGVIFSDTELPIVVEALRDYVNDRSILHTGNADSIYHELVDVSQKKVGDLGGAFVPADEALNISRTLENQAQKASDAVTMFVPRFFRMVHVAVPLQSQRKHRFAEKVVKTVQKSRKLQ